MTIKLFNIFTLKNEFFYCYINEYNYDNIYLKFEKNNTFKKLID